MTDLVLVERPSDRVAHVVLNRPERRNALTGPLADQMGEALETLNADDDVSVLVIRGSGGAFCSGLDLKEFSKDPQPDWVPEFGGKWRRVHAALFDSPKIVIGALERAAVNGGGALALACDFLICGDKSFLQVGEIQQGMAAPMNMAWLTLRFPESVIARIALVGDRIAGPELVRLGVAFESVADDGVVDAAQGLAERLAAHDPGGVARIKVSMRRNGLAASAAAAEGTAAAWFAAALASDPAPQAVTRPKAATDS